RPSETSVPDAVATAPLLARATLRPVAAWDVVGATVATSPVNISASAAMTATALARYGVRILAPHPCLLHASRHRPGGAALPPDRGTGHAAAWSPGRRNGANGT